MMPTAQAATAGLQMHVVVCVEGETLAAEDSGSQKGTFFPLCWTGGSILLHFLSLWISFLDYFRFRGAEWSFDVKKL